MARPDAIDDTKAVPPRLRWLALALVITSGCGGMFGSPIITRRVGGAERPGIFVSPFSYEHFVRGELAFLRGDLREALEEYQLARAGPEDDPLLVARIAEVLDRLGREREALAMLDHGEALDPSSELVWLARGRIHERHDRAEEARAAYARAAALAPSSEEAPIALAALLRARGEAAEADAVLERYLERASGAGAARARLALALERGQAQAAAEAVRALLEVAPARSDEVRAAARAALDAGRPELALRLLSALPDDEQDRPLRLAAALAAGDRSRAEGVLAGWMPRGPGELLEVARGYLAIGMADRAAELARVALSAEAGAEARLVLGRALRAQGRLGEAAEVLAAIDAGSGAWPEGPIELALVLRDAGRPALAAEVLARAQSRRSEVGVALALADARREAGDAEGALAALSGEDPRVRAARARLLESMGRVDEGVRVWAALPPDDPRLTAAERERARAEALVPERRDEALRALGSFVGRAPEDLLARARYAELLLSADRDAEAREVAGEALALAIDPPLRARLSALVTGARAPHARSPE